VKGGSMSKISKKNKPYSAADMRAVSDNPEWTKKDFAKAKRFGELFPDLASTIRRRGKQKAPTKQAVSMRLDADVVKAYKATGDGWQSRINSDLRKVMKLG
jgi:uncharacterized protein (DUF4415 family)